MSEQLWNDVRAPKWEPARTAWLMTFVDLTGLLVGFFVLVFSTKTLDKVAWDAMAGSLQAAFAPRIAVVAAIPDGMPNALVVTPGTHSGLGYLDTLLHQRVDGDPVWQHLVAEGKNSRTEMTYTIPVAARDLGDPATIKAWQRLAVTVRGWKNPLVVRMDVADGGDLAKAASQAMGLAAIVISGGAMDVSAEVRKAADNNLQLVVKAQ